jgi:hypothetical protein
MCHAIVVGAVGGAVATSTIVATGSARVIVIAAATGVAVVIIAVIAGVIGMARTGSATIGDRRNPHDTICSGGPTVEIVNINRITPGGEMLEITIATMQATTTFADKIMARGLIAVEARDRTERSK